jgi:hypothetical protein
LRGGGQRWLFVMASGWVQGCWSGSILSWRLWKQGERGKRGNERYGGWIDPAKRG